MGGWSGIMLLGVVAGALVVLAALVWPRGGLAGRLRRLRREAERVRLEDGLKHLLVCERTSRACTLENLAGRLEVSRGVASDILERLTERGLAMPGASGLMLTEAGRAYALRIVRTHRLWERYLADRTGVPAGEWHAAAERVEHRMSAEEADRLAARLGYPRYDPHGDPIPTARGDIPAPVGASLTAVEAGSRVVVVHVEDEPERVFDRLVASGVAPGLVLEVLGPGERGGGVRIRARGRVLELRAVDAGNVTVERLAGARGADDGAVGADGEDAADRADGTPSFTLADVLPGETVRVLGIAPACQGPQRRRLLDLGVVPGTRITPELVSAAGDPAAYRIRGALIALRRTQASWIEVTSGVAEKAG